MHAKCVQTGKNKQKIKQNSMGLMEFLFGSEKEKKHRSGNWTDADDWNCGRQDHHDGMFGFDQYEENDF